MKSDIKSKLSEPWVELKIGRPNKKQEIQYSQTFRQQEKLKFYQRAFDFLYTNKIVGDYFEFGCHTARTFRFGLKESIVRQMKMDFYAFDSFEGLPNHKNNKKQNPWHVPGLLSTSEIQFKKLVSKFSKHRKITTIKGFYENSLNNNLKKRLKLNKVKTSFINIDCDLEKSVSKSLDFALKFIVNGTILYIDDYYTTYKGDPRIGIPKIVKTLLNKNNIIYENWYQSSSCGRSFLLYK